MEKFEHITVSHVLHIKAFYKADNFFLIKKNEEIRIKIELSNTDSQLAICIVHDNVAFRDKMIRGCQDPPNLQLDVQQGLLVKGFSWKDTMM